MAKENGDTCPKEQVIKIYNACIYAYPLTQFRALVDSVGITWKV